MCLSPYTGYTYVRIYTVLSDGVFQDHGGHEPFVRGVSDNWVVDPRSRRTRSGRAEGPILKNRRSRGRRSAARTGFFATGRKVYLVRSRAPHNAGPCPRRFMAPSCSSPLPGCLQRVTTRARIDIERFLMAAVYIATAVRSEPNFRVKVLKQVNICVIIGMQDRVTGNYVLCD